MLLILSKNPLVAKPKIQYLKSADSLCVWKSKREMQVFFQGKYLKTYNIGLGKYPEGAKHFQGDGKTPEGLYHISCKNEHSDYHKALCISYPELRDVIYADWKHQKAGGAIEIQGLPDGYFDEGVKNGMNDWTAGCIAVKNRDIDELFLAVRINSKILILP